MRGRKVIPTAIKLLHNNPGRRPLNPHEPTAAGIDRAAPGELTDPLAVAEWTRITSAMADGHVLVTDRAAILGYCQLYARWRALEVEAARHPAIIKGINGGPMISPAMTAANRTFLLLLRTSAELGFTPSSRARIVAAPTAPRDDEFSRFLKRRT